MDAPRNFELDELENLHERMNWPRIVLLLSDMEKHYDSDNNWKLARRYGLTIHDLRAIRHWLFEPKVVIKGKVKRIVRAKIRESLNRRTKLLS